MMACFDDDFTFPTAAATNLIIPPPPSIPAPEPDKISSQIENELSCLKLSDEDLEEEPKISSVLNSPLDTKIKKTEKEEPKVIREWREAQEKRLEAKDEEEENAKIALHQTAKKELEDWYKRHSDQLSKLRSSHRSASSSTFLSSEAASMNNSSRHCNGIEWEKVARYCDFNPKSAKNTKDVSRMRSIILQLKQSNQKNNSNDQVST